jgi:hypothetical protein
MLRHTLRTRTLLLIVVIVIACAAFGMFLGYLNWTVWQDA